MSNSRTVVKTPSLIVLHDAEYPYTFRIFKSGYSDTYYVLEEDPFEHGLTIESKAKVLAIVRGFEPTFGEHELPKEPTNEQHPTSLPSATLHSRG